MSSFDWTQFQPYIMQLEQEGLVTRTFRRLDPERQATIIGAILDEATERGPAALNIKRVAKRAGANQCVTSLSIDTQATPWAAPISARPSPATTDVSAQAKIRLPAPARMAPARNMRLGPRRSTTTPVGTCTAA